MGDEIVKLYKSITKQSQVPTESSRPNSDSKTKSQINFLNINLNEYLTLKKSNQTVESQQNIFQDQDHFGHDR